MMNAKRAEFDRLWNSDGKEKREQFRNLMRAKLDQIKVAFTEDNARGYYLGEVHAAPPKETYEAKARPPERRRRFRRRR